MNWHTIGAFFQDVLGFELFKLGGTTLTVATLLIATITIVVSFYASRLASNALQARSAKRGVNERPAVSAMSSVVRYVILIAGFGVALQTIGIDLSALFAAGALFAVGIGFAMQNIAQNFVSGIILLFERSVKPGDSVVVGDKMVRIMEMGIRSTIVESRDGEHIVVPNSSLVQREVTNYSLMEGVIRARVLVGVAYESDLRQVRAVLSQVAAELDDDIVHHRPEVLLQDFADSAVVFDVGVWVERPTAVAARRSELRYAIWEAFEETGIVIAFPQLDVHLDSGKPGVLVDGPDSSTDSDSADKVAS